MTDEEIKKLAKAIVEEEQKHHGFYVDPKTHYDQHEELEKLLKAYNSAGNIVMKFILGAFLIGVVAAVAMGLGWSK